MRHTIAATLWLLLLLTGNRTTAQTAEPRQTQQWITGNVYDEASKAPLAGVVIALINNGIATSGTTSDSVGNYKLQVPLGRQLLRFTYMGYENRMANDILVTAGKAVLLNIAMQEAVAQLKEVSVVYSKAKDKTRTLNDMAMVSARSFNVDETKRYAGALGDPSRMAANFAGVASGNDATNDIVIRGNSPAGMLWQVEGLNIPNPNHYGALGSSGGPVSMINNNNIDKSDFMTSAFPAQYGNALAGVFDIKLREGSSQKNEFMVQAGFNGFEGGAEGPLGKSKKTSYLINYRYSTLGAFQKMGINFGTGSATPLYQDVNFKLTSRLSSSARLTLFGISGASAISFLGREVDSTKTDLYGGDPYTNQRVKYATSVTGLALEQRLSPKTNLKATVGFGVTYEKFHEDSISYAGYQEIPAYDHQFTTNKVSAVVQLTHKMNAKNNIETGITYDHTLFNLYDLAHNAGSGDETHLNSTGNFGLAQGYGQWKHRFSDKLSAVGGLHMQYATLSSTFAPEPRFSLRYVLSSRQAISGGYGLHHQAQTLYTYYIPTVDNNGLTYTNKNLGFTRSNHFVLTYDWNINENLRMKAEVYYQALSKAPVESRPSAYSELNAGVDLSSSYTDSLVNRGKGTNYGAELTLERFFKNGFYYLMTASVFDSRYKGSDNVSRNTGFNTGHVVNVLAGKEFKLGHSGSVLACNLKVTSVGGRYLTPLDLAASRQAGHAVYLTEQSFSERQPGYFRTDLKVAYRKEFKKSTLEIALDLQNLTNQKNIFNKYYDARNGKIVTVYQQNFFPVPMLRYTF
jgi:hypothetical protein